MIITGGRNKEQFIGYSGNGYVIILLDISNWLVSGGGTHITINNNN